MKKQRIFARYKIPNKEDLKKGLEYWAKKKETTLNNELDFYIKGRIGEIADSLEIILREEQRIKKAKKCIEQSVLLIAEGESKQLKSISNQYYSDLLSFKESEVKNRIK